jgi:putative flippase GtrA
LIASQVALIVFNHLLLRGNAGAAGFTAAVIGAAVSYVLSRWAWERKGKPDLLRETLPFWLVSACVWVILALANKLGVHLVVVMHLHKGWKKVIVENGTYFLANCVTFAARFLIFHYLLFTDRGKHAGSSADGSPDSPGESLTLTSAGDEPR